MLDVKILQIDRVFVRECLENSLEQAPVLVTVDPVLKDSWFDFFELEA